MSNQRMCNVMVKGEYIQEIYNWYEEGMLVVNRKYQRKLVWSLEEKCQLIDTIMRNYPVPIFLVVNNPEVKGKGDLVQKEIIDGLQRMEAIVSFINNEYYITFEGTKGYFNLDVLPGKGQLIREGKLVQRTPVLDFEMCKRFISYQLPISTIETNDAIVEDIFKRINSTGRKLSSQNLRQAGVTSLFNDLVYKTAAIIRGDYTDDNIIKLNDMPAYSIKSRGLHYGLNISDIFWTKQGIITEDGIRRSKDEEVLANMYNCVLNDYKSAISRQALNAMYDETSAMYNNNEKALATGEYTHLKDLFLSVFSDFNKIFGTDKYNFSTHLFANFKNYNKDLVFIILFLAIVQLRNENYIIEDYAKFAGALYHIADNELSEIISTSDCMWNVEVRNRLIERIKGVLRRYMALKEVSPEWSKEIVELLKKAEVEEQMYDFKIGFTDLRTGTKNPEIISKWVKTLTAMANTQLNSEGLIILGVADNENDADDFQKHYGVVSPKYNNYFITGIKDEAVKYYGSVARYYDTIKSRIQAEAKYIDNAALNYILSNMSIIRYNEQVLIVLKLKSDKPLFYDQKLYIRQQSHNKEIAIGSPEFYEIFKA